MKNTIAEKQDDIWFSVIMPTYNNAPFIRKAISSLKNQLYNKWELVIINDGSTDNTEEIIKDLLNDTRIRYIVNKQNKGLGCALNQGFSIARYNYIAYLPADDFYFEDHLLKIKEKFEISDQIFLVISGMTFGQADSLCTDFDKQTNLIRSDYPLQLVQASHKKTNKKWLERKEWVTEDLFLMFWNKILDKGVFTSTGQITCNWTSHPKQRHKIIGEKYEGCLNLYRSYYRVKGPIKMRISKYKFVDEQKTYKDFQTKRKPGKNYLKILLVGELAYNPERIYALEKAGHKLYGLWIKEPRYSFANIGPLPFGNVEDIPYENGWQRKIKKIKPDIIYALGNFDSISLAHEVLNAKLGIPFVWHFKEGPNFCIKFGLWKQLHELYLYADGKIFINNIIKTWYEQYLGICQNSLILDLDLPIQAYFNNQFSEKLSAKDKSIHTVVTGRLVGLNEKDIKSLAEQNIHLHIYSESAHELREGHNNSFLKCAPNHYHVHQHVPNDCWVKEFSQYDAGWLHCFNSENNGNLLNATWDDLNMPARIYTLAAGGIPMIQKDNSGHLVAMQEVIHESNIGIFYKDISKIGEILYDKEIMETLNSNVLLEREKFTFDYHVTRLIDFFHKIINK